MHLTRRLFTAQRLNLSGIFPAIPTPFDDNSLQIHEDHLRQNLERWQHFPHAGYVVLGSTGEFPYLKTEEKMRLLGLVKPQLRKDQLLIAGTGCESTDATIEMTRKAVGAGADAALIVTPCYYKQALTQRALVNHFEKVAESSEVPLIVYNEPVHTGMDLSVETIRLLSQHPNIIGLKDATGDMKKLEAIVEATRVGGFQVLAGSVCFLLPALKMGCVGGVCAAATVFGHQVIDLVAHHRFGHTDKAESLQIMLGKLDQAITRELGVAGLKAALDMLGYKGGPVRPPLLPLDHDEMLRLKKALDDAKMLPAHLD